MGTGCKSDPTRISIADISLSAEDPLSRVTRQRLRALGITTGIPTVFSTEKPNLPGTARLAPLPDHEVAKGTVDELSPLPSFRVRILPVLGTMPAFFGLCIANHILLSLAQYPTDYSPGKNRRRLYSECLIWLAGQESRLRGKTPGIRIPLSENDVGYVMEEMFRGKSVVSGFATRLVVCRWEAIPKETRLETEYPLGVTDMVVMSKEEAVKHEKLVLRGGKRVEEVYGKEVLERVERARREEESVRAFR